MTIMAPKNKWELSDMMKFALQYGKPITIRYPRGEAYDGLSQCRELIEYGKSEIIYSEKDIALFAVGNMIKTAEEVRDELKSKGYHCSLINGRFIKPIDEEGVLQACETHQIIVTLEENVASGGYGEKVRVCMNNGDVTSKLLTITIPDAYVEHGNVEILKNEIGIGTTNIIERIIEAYNEIEKN